MRPRAGRSPRNARSQATSRHVRPLAACPPGNPLEVRVLSPASRPVAGRDRPGHPCTIEPRLDEGLIGRRLAVALIVVGALLVAYAAVATVWRDPVTDLYARWRQERLGDALATEFVEFRAVEFQSGSGPRAASRAPDPEVVVAKNALRCRGGFASGSRWVKSRSRSSGSTRCSSTGLAGRRTSRAGPATTRRPGCPVRGRPRRLPRTGRRSHWNQLDGRAR
jgi:hypothetical protein